MPSSFNMKGQRLKCIFPAVCKSLGSPCLFGQLICEVLDLLFCRNLLQRLKMQIAFMRFEFGKKGALAHAAAAVDNTKLSAGRMNRLLDNF